MALKEILLIPYKVDTDNLVRGTQAGYNRCNASTAGQSSLCQTGFLNSVDDFCLWAPINPNSIVGDVEGDMVAWCTKPGRGTRVIPAGAIRGVQLTKTPDYVQVVGFIDQTRINIASGDQGGEMDPHGADLRGNPLGGLMYSNAYTNNKNAFRQVIEWHNFMGSDIFCLKACDPARPNAARFCEHIYDRIGCAYNAPSNAQPGVFEACKGDNQDFPGVYTDAQGKVQTYRQPPESLGAITTIPYTARVPRSSDCVRYESAALFAGSVSPGTGGGTPGGGVTVTTTGTSASATSDGGSGSGSGSESAATSTGDSSTSTTTGHESTITAPPETTAAPDGSTGSLTVAPPAQTGNSGAVVRVEVPVLAIALYGQLGLHNNTMMVLSLSIPEDIISTILDELSSDNESLKQCSLVSQSFLPLCHKLLFSSICLNHPTRTRGFYRVITNNVSFASYIRRVEIISSVSPEFRGRDWVTFEHTLAPLLQALHNLHAFTLRKNFLPPLPWNTLPADLRSTILDLSVPSITLAHVANVPMGHFRRFICLKDLKLLDIELDHGHPLDLGPLNASLSSPLPVGYLESLEILDSPMCGRHLVTTLTDPRSSLKLSRLKDLELFGDHGFTGTIMETAGQTLQRVVWYGLGEGTDCHPTPFTRFPSSFSALPALRFLTIGTKFARGRAYDPLPLLAQALAGATPRDACALEHLKVYISFYGVWKFAITPRDVDTLDEYAFWPALDEALTRPGVYTKLTRVGVGLQVGGSRQAFAGLPKRRMPMLLEKGVLYMMFTDQ
ncbi:hypothetical protein D9615_009059 [Tricholomella constricta]|uniref:Uncharacterized protein n=1 Tax=Tricholomella constricta TaxID=117010 RepID=A0A8H5H0G2_9AGAR|nr:hypothetical protein D9615_009059 [Tricholomella constricta]